jgi:hypothetical protein
VASTPEWHHHHHHHHHQQQQQQQHVMHAPQPLPLPPMALQAGQTPPVTPSPPRPSQFSSSSTIGTTTMTTPTPTGGWCVQLPSFPEVLRGLLQPALPLPHPAAAALAQDFRRGSCVGDIAHYSLGRNPAPPRWGAGWGFAPSGTATGAPDEQAAAAPSATGLM